MSKETQNPVQPRKRSVTHMALDWLTDRLRKCEEIKHKINSGCYQVDSGKVAAAIANESPAKGNSG